MLHIEDTDTDPSETITRDELAELVACTLARFDRIERRLDELEAARAQREDATRAVTAAFSGVTEAVARLNAAS